jgi:hypothetical protein
MKPIFTAIVEDDRRAVESLLKADPGLATRRTDKARLFDGKILHWIYVGDTALHLAAAGHRLEIAGLLLAAGADPNSAANHRAGSPLHYAADGFSSGPNWNSERQVQTIRRLVGAGALINAQDKNGATPLHRAVRTRCAKAVICLLDLGADATLPNKPGSTPFHLAVQNTGHGGTGAEASKAAQREIIQEFLRRGLSPTVQDGRGKTVLDCAKSGWIRDVLCDGAQESV